MIDPVRDLASVREATQRLLSTATRFQNTSGPSRLPGWTRGHVLAHVARNADALVNVLEGRPMYVSGEAREADIERDAARPLDVQLDDVRESAERFQATGRAPADWARTVELRNGVTDSASRVPFRRLIEMELHHVDLDAGYELEDLSKEFTEREIAFLARRFTGIATVPPTRIVTVSGEWRTGGTEGAEVTVSGPTADVLGWLAGRRDGAALTAVGGALPVVPPL